MPSMIRMTPPAIAVYLRKSGALFSSQPVTPPKRSIGEIAVPKPNRIAIATLPAGSTRVIVVVRIKINGAQTIKPLVKPNENAPKSTPKRLILLWATLASGALQLQVVFLAWNISTTPIATVTKPKASEE